MSNIVSIKTGHVAPWILKLTVRQKLHVGICPDCNRRSLDAPYSDKDIDEIVKDCGNTDVIECLVCYSCGKNDLPDHMLRGKPGDPIPNNVHKLVGAK